MNKTQFKWAFMLSELASKQQKMPSALTKAAVLIPMIERNGELFVLLTQRASHLKHHPGQVSFPGGRYETSDRTLVTTALRETHEEVGISPDKVQIIGQMHNHQTISKYIVTPFVGFVDPDYQITIDKNEVDAAFEVPWTFFLHRANHHHLNVSRFGTKHNVHFMPFKERFIWGTTAAIIHDLVCHFE